MARELGGQILEHAVSLVLSTLSCLTYSLEGFKAPIFERVQINVR